MWTTVEAPPRGGGQGNQYWIRKPPILQSFSITRSWGSNPASGNATFISDGTAESESLITAGSLIRIVTEYGHNFVGLCRSDNPSSSSSGHSRALEFVDLRVLLDYDHVFCSFNKVVKLRSGNIRRRMYEHVFPTDFISCIKRHTPLPLTAQEILRMILKPNTLPGGSPTTESPWVNGAYEPIWHPVQTRNSCPILNLDFNGDTLSSAILRIAEAQGLNFTHDPSFTFLNREVKPVNDYRLWFARLGEGVIPTWNGSDMDAGCLGPTDGIYFNSAGGSTEIYPSTSDNRRDGISLSFNPTRVTILGDKNLYMCLNLTMTPDWNPLWNSFVNEHELVLWCYDNEVPLAQKVLPGDDLPGWHLAAARAKTITVWEVALKRGAAWLDYRLYSGQCRNNLPAILYINALLFRAFRPPDSVHIGSALIPTKNLKLVGQALVQVASLQSGPNPIYAVPNNAGVYDGSGAFGSGLAMVMGYQLGQDGYKAIAPENFSFDAWNNYASQWSATSFQIDDGGDNDLFCSNYIIFDTPVYNGSSLITTVNKGAGALELAVFQANPVLTFPPVKAALTFEGERFTYTLPLAGTGQMRDHVESVNGIHIERVVVNAYNGNYVDIPFDDGESALQKAARIAAPLYARPYAIKQGGFVRPLTPGCTATPLCQLYSRINLDIGPNGRIESVDFTSEGQANSYTPEKDFDRRRVTDRLFPGQEELKDQANVLLKLSRGFRKSPAFVKTMHEFFNGMVGGGQTKAILPPIDG